MKLYLSSYRIPNVEALVKLAGKPIADLKIGIVSNAQDYYIEKARKIKVKSVVDFFESFGASGLIEIDLRDFDESEQIAEIMKDLDLVWVMGGNTFMLRYEMKRSGFDTAIKEVMSSGIIYGGNSAGAIVAGNTLKGIEHVDEAKFAEEIFLDGLNLTDHFILPHVGNNMYEERTAEARKAHEEDGTVVELSDKQALVINGSTEKVV